MTEQWNELKETIEELRNNDGTDTQNEVCEFLVNYMNILERQVQKPYKEWVPYNEFSFNNKLPEEGERVLLCSDSGNMVMTYGWHPTEEKDFWIWGDICDEFGKVVAWMPLPKPYKKDIGYIF